MMHTTRFPEPDEAEYGSETICVVVAFLNTCYGRESVEIEVHVLLGQGLDFFRLGIMLFGSAIVLGRAPGKWVRTHRTRSRRCVQSRVVRTRRGH